jgi:hypothetical protein
MKVLIYSDSFKHGMSIILIYFVVIQDCPSPTPSKFPPRVKVRCLVDLPSLGLSLNKIYFKGKGKAQAAPLSKWLCPCSEVM